MHGNEIPVEDAGVAHRLAPHAQQEVRTRTEQTRIHGDVALDVGVGQDQLPGGHAPHQRQPHGSRSDGLAQAGCHAPCRATAQDSPGLQRQEVLVRGARLLETERGGDLRQRGRQPVRGDVRGEEVEDGLLAVGEGRHGTNICTFRPPRHCRRHPRRIKALRKGRAKPDTTEAPASVTGQAKPATRATASTTPAAKPRRASRRASRHGPRPTGRRSTRRADLKPLHGNPAEGSILRSPSLVTFPTRRDGQFSTRANNRSRGCRRTVGSGPLCGDPPRAREDSRATKGFRGCIVRASSTRRSARRRSTCCAACCVSSAS